MNRSSRVKFIVIIMSCFAAGWLVVSLSAEDKQTVDKVQSEEVAVELASQPEKSTAMLQSKEIKHPFYPALTRHEQEIQAALQSKTNFNFPDVPLSKAIGTIQNQHGINIFIDALALQELGLTVDEPINVSLSGISLKSALNIILNPIGLDYVVNNEVLKITTTDDVTTTFKVRIYPVADLCDSPEEYQALENVIRNICLTTGKPKFYPVGDFVIGGPGNKKIPFRSKVETISVVPQCKALVINQTDRVHNSIVGLLNQLRQVRKDQAGVSTETN